jgi:O-methyltransferase involved in polyketide biosynthesis
VPSPLAISQFVIIATGLDYFGYRPERPIRVFQAGVQATQAAKRRTPAAAAIAIPRPAGVATDFEPAGPAASLVQCGLDPLRPVFAA